MPARLGSGPKPDPTALRRDRAGDAGWTTLPAEGYTGPAPEWPLRSQSRREGELWTAYWRKPQAVIWIANRMEYEVALHVRRLAEVEMPGSLVSLGTLVRQQASELLLSLPAMTAARIRIAAVEPVEEVRPAGRAPSRSARSRLKVVDSGDAAG